MSQNGGKISVKRSTFNGLVIGLVALVGVAAFFAGSYMSAQSSDQISKEDLDKALAKTELRILQDRLPTGHSEPIRVSADDDPVIGDPDAPITIIEFSDFQCPYCARFHIQTLPAILEEYIDKGQVKLVFRDFPIQGIHPNAMPAAVAAECANEQEKFKGMHDALFENQDQWSSQSTADAISLFVQYASDIQLDADAFASCLSSPEQVDEVRKDLEDGRTYGISGTPGFFVGNDQDGYVEINGAQPFETFKKIIDVQLGA